MPNEKCVANAEPVPTCDSACNQAPRQLTDKEKIKSLQEQLENSFERAESISSSLYKAENKAQVLEDMLYEKATILKRQHNNYKQISKENKLYENSLWKIYDLLDKKERRTDIEKEMLEIVSKALDVGC